MHIVKRKVLNKEEILKHVTEEQILYAFWPAGKELKIDKGAISSPFRKDDDPSLLVGYKDNRLIYKDLGDNHYKGDIWKFVEQIEGCTSHQQALQKVDLKFNLGYTTGQIVTHKPQVIKWESPIVVPKKPPVIQVTTRKPTKEELRYWAGYYQGTDDLKREHIFCPKEIYRNRKKLDNRLMTFCYWCPDIEKWKLYRPHAPKRTDKTPPDQWKWDNNIGSLTYVENIDKMVGPVGICTKSRKDRMVLRTATGIDAICSIQAEDPAAITDDILYDIWSNVGYKVCAMDNDPKGKQASWWFTGRGYHHVNVPDRMLEEGISDFADMARVYGIESVTKHMKQKWVI